MVTSKRLLIGVVGLALLALSTSALADTTYLRLKADKSHDKASGILALSDDSIGIIGNGLRPNAVYTVWFVNTKPRKHEAGAGAAPYMFRTDARGNGVYLANLDKPVFGRWEMVMVVLHPDGDPTNMKGMVGALSVKIPEKAGY
jgi:hypothetical protein